MCTGHSQKFMSTQLGWNYKSLAEGNAQNEKTKESYDFQGLEDDREFTLDDGML